MLIKGSPQEKLLIVKSAELEKIFFRPQIRVNTPYRRNAAKPLFTGFAAFLLRNLSEMISGLFGIFQDTYKY